MGRIEQEMIDKDKNDDLIEFLTQLLEMEEVSGPAIGISKKVIDKGIDSLSERQKYVIDNIVANYVKENGCERCDNGNISYLTDHIFVSENRLCPTCQNDHDKFMRD